MLSKPFTNPERPIFRQLVLRTCLAFNFRISQRSRRSIVTRYTVRIHPSSTKLQAALRDLMRVLFAASVVQPTRSAHCYRECSSPGVSLQDATRYRRQDKGCDRLPGIPSVRDILGDPRTPSRGRVALSGAYARMGELAKEQGGHGAQGRPVQSRGRRSSTWRWTRSALREYQQTSPFLPPCTVCSYTATLMNLVDLAQLSCGDPWDDPWHSWREDWRHLKFDRAADMGTGRPPVLGAGLTGNFFPA